MSVRKKNADGSESNESLFPSWKGFVRLLANRLKEEDKNAAAKVVEGLIEDDSPEYLEALERAQKGLGDNLWYRLFDESFDVPASKAYPDSLKLNKLIWELGNNLIITTNVDRVLQWTCPEPAEFRLLDVQNVEYAQLQNEEIPKRPAVWYLHGHIDHKEKVIFTRTQFEDFYKEGSNEAKLQTLLSFFTRQTFLFIGFSLGDPYLREQLEYIHGIYKGGADSYFILLSEDELKTANLPDYVRPVKFPGFGKPLEDLIEELIRIAKEKDDDGTGDPGGGKPKPPKDKEKERLRDHFNVPFPSKGDDFVGRVGKSEEIWKALKTGTRAAIGQAVSIEGFGGLGKTQLAVEYAYEYRDKYENGVYWITADEDISLQLIKIGETLKWISQSDTGFDQAEFVRNRFRKLSDCLIIFDNVDEQEAIKEYLPETGYQPHILVTSRQEQYGFHPIDLQTLSENEARDLLIRIAGRSPNSEAEEKALENISKELDGLPLAVELVGGYLRRRRTVSFQDYFEFLENEPIDKIENKFPENTFAKRNKSIIRALQISEKLLKETEYLEDILDILAWSGKSSMGYSLLKELVGASKDFILKDTLGVASELHFIKQEENAERYAIHRLLAKVRQFEKPLKERKEWHQKIIGNLIKWFLHRKDEFKFLTEFEAEVIHLQQWQLQSTDIFPIETVYLTDFESYPLWHRGNYTEAEDLLEKALDLYKTNDLNDEKLQANIYNDLGVINRNLGNIRVGFEFKLKALSIGRNAFEEKSADIAKFLSNLGTTYGKLGDHRKALELEQQALEIRREIFGEKHPDVALSLSNLGSTYDELGDHRKALELKQQALEIQREIFGEKHPGVAISLNNLGVTYSNLRKNELAYSYTNSALEIQREILGEKHPDTILSYYNLVIVLSNSGKTVQAGMKAAEFFSFIPQNHPKWKWFEEISRPYRKKKNRQKKRS